MSVSRGEMLVEIRLAVTEAITRERARISTAITAAAAEVGGVGAKVMELVARAVRGEEKP